MTDRVVDLGVGSQVWFEGSVWRVEELASDAVTLSAGAKVRSVATRVLATQSVVMDDGPVRPEGEELVAVTLGTSRPETSLFWRSVLATSRRSCPMTAPTPKPVGCADATERSLPSWVSRCGRWSVGWRPTGTRVWRGWRIAGCWDAMPAVSILDGMPPACRCWRT